MLCWLQMSGYRRRTNHMWNNKNLSNSCGSLHVCVCDTHSADKESLLLPAKLMMSAQLSRRSMLHSGSHIQTFDWMHNERPQLQRMQRATTTKRS
jgi:hypothetical protein